MQRERVQTAIKPREEEAWRFSEACSACDSFLRVFQREHERGWSEIRAEAAAEQAEAGWTHAAAGLDEELR